MQHNLWFITGNHFIFSFYVFLWKFYLNGIIQMSAAIHNNSEGTMNIFFATLSVFYVHYAHKSTSRQFSVSKGHARLQ